MGICNKFASFLSKNPVVNAVGKVSAEGKLGAIPLPKAKSVLDLAGNFLPLIAGAGFAIGGVYGLEAYLGIELAKGVRDNLKKNKMLSNPVLDWYEMFGGEVLVEDVGKKEYDKIKAHKQGKISDDNSVLAYWKSTYDK